VALRSVYNNSRILNLFIFRVLESILIKGNHTKFAKIITSVIKN
jgi:hypothetical protein